MSALQIWILVLGMAISAVYSATRWTERELKTIRKRLDELERRADKR